MKDASSVISQATDGIGVELAKEYEVTAGRMYEILGKDSTYPKTKKLIRAIGHVDKSPNKDRVRIIKADMDALFDDILGTEATGEVGVKHLHKEAAEAIDAQLEGKPAAEQLKELRDLAVIVNQMISGREKVGEIREFARAKVAEKNGPRGVA